MQANGKTPDPATASDSDPAGNLLQEWNSDRLKARCVYDIPGSRIGISDLSGAAVTSTYDHAPCAGQRLWYNYNQMGQLVQVIDRQNGNQTLVTYTYDKNGRRIRTVLANGTLTNCTCNEQGAVTRRYVPQQTASGKKPCICGTGRILSPGFCRKRMCHFSSRRGMVSPNRKPERCLFVPRPYTSAAAS